MTLRRVVFMLCVFWVTRRAGAADERIPANATDLDRLGYGYSTVTGRYSEYPCVVGAKSDSRQGGATVWQWIESSSFDELASKIKNRFGVELRYQPASASIESGWFTEREVSSATFNVVGGSVALAAGDSFSSEPSFTKFAEARRGKPSFARDCGDRYVKAIQNGGAVFVIGSLLSNSSEERQTFELALKAAVDGDIGGKGKTETEELLQRLHREQKSEIRVLRVGPLTSLVLSNSGKTVSDAFITTLVSLRTYAASKFLEDVKNPSLRTPTFYILGEYAAIDPDMSNDSAEPAELEAAVRASNSISRYLSDLATIRDNWKKGGLFWGPIDSEKLEKEISTWSGRHESLARAIDACAKDHKACSASTLTVDTPSVAPSLGRRFPIVDTQVGGDTVNVASDATKELLSGNEGYKRPLVMRVVGEWSTYCPHRNCNLASHCTAPVITALAFSTGGTRFMLSNPRDRAVLESITGTKIREGRNGQGLAPGNNIFLIENVPRSVPLRVSVTDSAGGDDAYYENVVCGNDPPAIEIWEYDLRIHRDLDSAW
jgi:hypothetical protein